MANIQHLDYRGRRLRLAWEEARHRADRSDDPFSDVDDAEQEAWGEWQRWADAEDVCAWCCATTVHCADRACLR